MKSIKVNLLEDNFTINNVSIVLPIHIKRLEEILNSSLRSVTKKYNTIYTWDNLGILAYSKNGEIVESLLLSLKAEDFDFSTKQSFKGQFNINSEDSVSYYVNNKDMRVKMYDEDKSGSIILNNISVKVHFDDNKNTESIEISHFTGSSIKVIPAEKYEIKRLDDEIVKFSDFGFKICIIEELMYKKELLKPKFDLYEFIRWYKKRSINLEKEGYEPIPEVTQYFKDLPIPKKYASEITEIYQDGGNDIYMQLLRFGEGWEDYWDINTIEDVKQFPNLKKVILCYAKDNIVDEMNNFGIKAEWI
ncbi:hypothetical protein [uncultured Aquimarina sp.]|uniref:DUF6892 domain-containing protein n=1 Tax=uncultured Aquimarina sp. TaxID=575652 RepID=UPI002631B1D3|nr:hypothetical protein [uncultured Aquimarina sp.]